MSIEVTYELERLDSARFHGWVVWECYDDVKAEYFSSTSLDEARAVFNDLHPEIR